MRTASAELQALLATRQFYMADLYTFTLTDGTVLHYTSFDVDLGSFSSDLGWERTQWKLSTGLGIDEMTVKLHALPTDLVNGIPVIEHIAAGYWDGAAALVERGFMDTPGNLVGTINVFSGNIGTIDEIGRIQCQMTLRSRKALLDQALPKATFGPGCRHNLFDVGCGLNRGSFTVSSTVGAGSTASVVNTGQAQTGAIAPPAAPVLSAHTVTDVNLPPNANYYVVVTYVTPYGESLASPESFWIVVPTNGILHVASPAAATGATGWNAYIGTSSGDEQLQNGTPLAIGTDYDEALTGIYLSGVRPPTIATQGFYALGTIKFTSGANKGITAVIDSSTNAGAVTLRVPLPFAPATGDTFDIIPGCDKTMGMCANKFSNLIHFGGTPFVPVAEMGG